MLKKSYFIQTAQGKLQLLKGAYLTLLKRKNSVIKTLSRSNHHPNNDKKTMHKSYKHISKTKNYHCGKFICYNTARKERDFRVYPDKEIFQNCNLELIREIQYDNDNDSDWTQVNYNTMNLSMSLSLAAFDNRFQ